MSNQMPTVLCVAAESMEFAGLLKRLPEAASLPWPVAYGRCAESGGRRWLLVANGPGPKLSAAAVDEAVKREKVDAVVSVGFCGGLDPALAAGDVFIADRVVETETGQSMEAEHPACGPAARGAIACDDRVLQTAEEKRAVRAKTGAAAVDMESMGVQARARVAGVRFYCIRAVTDTAEESFSVDFNSLRDDDGRFSRGGIVLAALRRPVKRVPELIRLAGRARMASERLGGFLAGCSF